MAMASASTLRALRSFRQPAAGTFRMATQRTSFLSSPLRRLTQRRMQSTAAEATPAPEAAQGALGKLWNSPVGPKTVHFWAPIMKWGLVIAGIGDFARPAESISLMQNLSLMATGLIWTRWCFVIRPQNYFLATVNFFVFLTSLTQVTRVLMYRSTLNKDGIAQEAAKEAKDEGKLAEGIAKDPKRAAKKAEV